MDCGVECSLRWVFGVLEGWVLRKNDFSGQTVFPTVRFWGEKSHKKKKKKKSEVRNLTCTGRSPRGEKYFFSLKKSFPEKMTFYFAQGFAPPGRNPV